MPWHRLPRLAVAPWRTRSGRSWSGTSRSAGDSYLIRGRSSGLFTNPNILGFWAAMATMLGFTIVSPRVRPLALALALLTLVLSQSRGATVALVTASAVGILGSVLLGRIPKSQLRALAGALLLLVLLAPVVLIALPAQSADRFEALVNVFTARRGGGPEPGGSHRLLGRGHQSEHAGVSLGYVGPAGTVLGTAVDSDWFRAFAQGSIVLVFANLLLLMAPAGVGSYPGRYALALLAIIIAIAGITQTSLTYPPVPSCTGLFWVVGCSGQSTTIACGRQEAPASVRSIAGTAGDRSAWSATPATGPFPERYAVAEECVRAGPSPFGQPVARRASELRRLFASDLSGQGTHTFHASMSRESIVSRRMTSGISSSRSHCRSASSRTGMDPVPGRPLCQHEVRHPYPRYI